MTFTINQHVKTRDGTRSGAADNARLIAAAPDLATPYRAIDPTICITEGEFAFQHGEIGILMQIVGIVVCLGMGMVTAAILCPIFKATIGLRVSDDDQAEGLDIVVWDGIPPDVNSNVEST